MPVSPIDRDRGEVASRVRAARDRVIVVAVRDGVSGRAVAGLFGLAPSRVSQIVRSTRDRAERTRF